MEFSENPYKKGDRVVPVDDTVDHIHTKYGIKKYYEVTGTFMFFVGIEGSSSGNHYDTYKLYEPDILPEELFVL